MGRAPTDQRGVCSLVSLTAGSGISFTIEAGRRLKECEAQGQQFTKPVCAYRAGSSARTATPAIGRLQMFWPG
jgi:hypothetical protein